MAGHNVRRLANEVRRAVALSDGDEPIGPELLSAEVIEAGRAMASTIPPTDGLENDLIKISPDQSLRSAVDTVERSMIERALASSGGNSAAAARTLGLSRKGFYLKRRRLNIPETVTA